MPAWLLVVLVVLATHRATRLLVADTIPLIKVPRDAAVEWLDPATPGRRAHLGGFGKSVAYLITCPWCMSAYTGGVIVAATAWLIGLPVPWLVWAAASSFTGWAASAEAEHEQRHALRERQIEHGEGGR